MSNKEGISGDSTISSPCVRNCCLDSQDICLGCFRHLDEIIGWQQRSNEEKIIIQRGCDKRRKLAVKKI